ncbi:hypothetical protein ACE1SV_75560 [Streptomyces sennicomposti]
MTVGVLAQVRSHEALAHGRHSRARHLACEPEEPVTVRDGVLPGQPDWGLQVHQQRARSDVGVDADDDHAPAGPVSQRDGMQAGSQGGTNAERVWVVTRQPPCEAANSHATPQQGHRDDAG